MGESKYHFVKKVGWKVVCPHCEHEQDWGETVGDIPISEDINEVECEECEESFGFKFTIDVEIYKKSEQLEKKLYPLDENPFFS